MLVQLFINSSFTLFNIKLTNSIYVYICEEGGKFKLNMLPYCALLASLMKCVLVSNVLLIKITRPLKQFSRLNSNVSEVRHSIYAMYIWSVLDGFMYDD